MRQLWVGVVLTVAMMMPNVGNAQVFQFRTPPPDVSAAGADWQIDSEPIVVGGLTYYPTRGFRLFDGQVMAQTGMYENVPVYSDTTLEPYMEIYVPLGSGRMRVYERRRDRELAGTTGSHVPTFPVESPSAPQPPERPVGDTDNVGTRGTFIPSGVSSSGSADIPQRSRPRRTTIITNVSHDRNANGVWLDFNGARWYSDGPAVSFSPDRFEPIGEYHGFPVYRDKISGSTDLWVAVVKDGPLAPYAKR
ncbi:MAG: hypothetical protein ACRD2I_20300 [Vicinamibacterales bacterium]